MNLIVACDKNYGIGNNGTLLINLPTDLKFFKEKTSGKVVVMGRKTLESLPKGNPLPNRTNIVITHNMDYIKEGAVIVHSEDELFNELKKYDSNDIFIIGGSSIYNRYMDMCDTLYITKIEDVFEADCHISNVDNNEKFKLVKQSEVTEEKGVRFRFTEYRKVK